MRVLVVDSDIKEATEWCSFLRELGNECVLSQDGASAYHRIAYTQPPFDVVLINTSSKQLDGFLLKKKLNNDSNRLPTIFVCEKAIPNRELMLKGFAAIRFISKPLVKEDLVKLLSSAIAFSQHIRLRPEFLAPIAKLNMVIDGESIDPAFLLSTSYTIGRSENSDIRVFNRACSREAAILQRAYSEEDQNKSYYSIVDYSRNGLTVNGKRVRGFKELSHGDIIEFAGFWGEYLLLDAESKTDSKSTLV